MCRAKMNIVNGKPKHGLGLSIAVGLVFMLAIPVLADFQAGFDAYNGGDYDTALKEFRPLAERGKAVAQWSLGIMYERGRSVPQDYVQAYRWYTLAAAKGLKEAVKGRDLLEKRMTPAQLAEAQRRAREWKPKGE